MSPSVDVKEFLAGFLAESEEHFRTAGQNLLALETSLGKGQANARAVREAFRAIHTLKGLSAMVGADPIVDIAHAMEAVLRAADRAPGSLQQGAIDPLVRGLRAMEERVAALGRGATVPIAPAALLDELVVLDPSHLPAPAPAAGEISLPPELLAKIGPAERQQLIDGLADGRRAARVDFIPSAEKAAQGINITSVRENVGKVAEIVKVIPLAGAGGGLSFALVVLTASTDEELAQAASSDPAKVAKVVVATAAPAAAALPEDGPDELPADSRRAVVRVEVERLDDALERLSALVVTRFRLGRAVADLKAAGADVRQLADIVAENGRQLRDLRGAIMRARMVRVSEMLERVPLIVRGLSRSTGKPVRVELDAGKAELDKAVADRIFPAIVHLIRNAVDHGLEPLEERRRLGKPDEGVITVRSAERSNTQLELSVSDDGKGIDAARVAQAAGREVPTTAAGLLELIAMPGLSTQAEATTTSGRGFGMDIVKRLAVDQLGGELLLETKPGVGTTFTLRIPLTITIVDAFSFVCGVQPFVVPVSMVEEIVEIDPSRLVRSPSREGQRDVQLLQRRGEAVPLIALDDVLQAKRNGGSARKALIVRRNGDPFAFAVDRMLGQQEVVVRPLEDKLVRVAGITGATDLGDGKPTLVLDLIALTGLLTEVRA